MTVEDKVLLTSDRFMSVRSNDMLRFTDENGNYLETNEVRVEGMPRIPGAHVEVVFSTAPFDYTGEPPIPIAK